MSLSISIPPQSLSSGKTLSGSSIPAQSLFLTTKLSHLSLTAPTSIPRRTTPIRMGGGPRTYPGGVSKWQWKRMQAKKSKQLLKARLARERQIYEMRKRAELKAAISELERPWETVEKPPNLFSVSADEQLKVLADRFQKPGGLDLWSERDGPELFRPDNGLPSSRFFPKGVVHSVKPYGNIENMTTTSEEFETSGSEEDSVPGPIGGSIGKIGARRKGYSKNSRSSPSGSDKGGNVSDFECRSLEGESGNFKGKLRKKGSRRTYLSDSEGMNSGDVGFRSGNVGRNRRLGGTAREFWKGKSEDEGENMNSEVFDMSLQNDGSYGFELES
ncbi:putative DEAD-box ATP-dependent RNA helicase 48 [Sesamum alatum]|uniref:DEAD-box ATP-dependent RNA helicase 48 n=1 Tax=Sesamum alatum TaxID=300844 RepID=A0AAE2CEC6_9LAMI|nr:putative DEAD-box ATP-dependent RNA helicase 48 [Sesamum alatum]